MATSSVRTVQAFQPNTNYQAWISYDGAGKKLAVYVSGNGSKPTTPALLAPLDILAVVGSTTTFVGFTGGTTSYWWIANEHHSISNFGYQTVAPGQLAGQLGTGPAPACTYSETSLQCTNFAGSKPFRLFSGGVVTPAPLFALNLEGTVNWQVSPPLVGHKTPPILRQPSGCLH